MSTGKPSRCQRLLKQSRFLAAGILLPLAGIALVPAQAHAWWPWTPFEGSARVDPIPPLGTNLPESYRRTYNRPSYIGGKIAAKIAPSSQEAMAFHRAETLGLYDANGVKGFVNGKHCTPQRVEQHYFYPKPWEVLTPSPFEAETD
ncbi:hypothetical protein SAMN06265222_104166 [Neorhodopirellula lusitana]|uniref:Uncharacterized protein n=1 Tax=Neorhodopirellula lusitana TaxID=445327 RepID=A0ABY1Q371_9BACT|nr:hypothetical protein [Neorhodopirellula lusitana]SMP53865.1 hypothetical protein SAMN06265222_104166 [Neorhodopirellula lusitana]